MRSTLAVLVVVTVASGCASRSPTPHRPVDYELPAEIGALAPPLTLGPFPQRADAFNAQTPSVATDELETELFERLRPSLHEDPVRDARLDVAAGALSRLADRATITRSATEFALYEQGVPEPLIGVATVSGNDLDALTTALGPQLAPLRAYGAAAVGIGHMDGQFVVVLAHVPRFALRTLPRHLGRDDYVEIVGTLAAGLRTPTVTITRDDGQTEHRSFTRLGDEYSALLACNGAPGRRWVTIEALDDAKVQQRLVYAPIDCGDEPPRTYRTEPHENLRGGDPAQIIARLINRDRLAAGLDPLLGDVRARDAAHRHVLHLRSGATAPAREDLLASGLLPARQAAAAFHVDSIEEAAEALLGDAALREALLGRQFTHAGIAMSVRSQGGYDLAIQLVTIPPKIDVPRATAAILAKLQDATAPHPIVEIDQISSVATWYATQLSIGWDASVLEYTMKGLIASTHLKTVADVRTPERIEDLDVASLVPTQRRPRFVGLSVVQSPHDGALAGRIQIVILFGL